MWNLAGLLGMGGGAVGMTAGQGTGMAAQQTAGQGFGAGFSAGFSQVPQIGVGVGQASQQTTSNTQLAQALAQQQATMNAANQAGTSQLAGQVGPMTPAQQSQLIGSELQGFQAAREGTQLADALGQYQSGYKTGQAIRAALDLGGPMIAQLGASLAPRNQFVQSLAGTAGQIGKSQAAMRAQAAERRRVQSQLGGGVSGSMMGTGISGQSQGGNQYPFLLPQR